MSVGCGERSEPHRCNPPASIDAVRKLTASYGNHSIQEYRRQERGMTMTDAVYAIVHAYDQAPKSEWFRHCREAAKPFVVIRPQPDSADVLWDYVTLPPCCDRILAKRLRGRRHRPRDP
jgi:hypothetical protein